MSALFEKDIRLIMIRRSALILFLVIGVVFSWEFSSSYSGAYMTMLGSLLGLSTLSYDDSDNCMEFLFTLPCTRKQYVIEKYLFIYSFSFIAGFIGMVIIMASNLVQGNPITATMVLETILSEIPILLMVGAIMIPLQLKFGPEKSRTVLLGIIGVVFILAYMVNRLADPAKILLSIDKMLDTMNPFALGVGVLVVMVVLSVVSFFITLRIMENKEY